MLVAVLLSVGSMLLAMVPVVVPVVVSSVMSVVHVRLVPVMSRRVP